MGWVSGSPVGPGVGKIGRRWQVWAPSLNFTESPDVSFLGLTWQELYC